jgi:SNF2-related domain/Bacterial SNF2 helicase associated/Helicase conserved C-terminal domain
MLDLTTNLLAEIGGWPALKEARGLVERGRVRNARREGNVIRATVQGAEKTHEPQITLADRVANIEVRCTCAESRRTGRVCPHALAAGLALLQPATPKVAVAGPREGSAHNVRRLPRVLLDDAPSETPRLELTILLPLLLNEALTKDPVRIILEARRGDDTHLQPFENAVRGASTGFAISEEDDHVLTTLESSCGTASGINAVSRSKLSAFLRALADHPRVWIGKKQRIEVHAFSERPRVLFTTRDDGALELSAMEGPASADPRTTGRSSLQKNELPGWHFDGAQLSETPSLPPGFTSNTRIISRDQIPDFLTRELPALERSCELVFAPGFEEFRLEIGQPTFEARLDGALSGLTLELIAHYHDKEISLTEKTESNAFQRYLPTTGQLNGFWRRNVLAERKAVAEVERAGFTLIRSGAATYSLISENQVARFLANILPRWRRNWTVSFGSRLQATMATIDIAEPEFSLQSSSGEDWLGLDLKLSVQGKPIPLDPAEIQRWLQTGQSHARTANKRILLVPTEAWSEMKEVLAECEVDQKPGQIRVGRTFAPYLKGALTAEGFRSGGKAVAELPPANVQANLDANLWTQLRPYQAHGVEWLAGLAQQKFNGLLADDMGLGKTLQALAFCAWLKKINGAIIAPALIVCPTSLVINWQREAARFTPHLRTLDLTGSDRTQKLATRNEYDLLITSYAILRRDIEHYRKDEFSLVILDEAQHIKNRSSQNAQSAKALRSQHRLILTGTPLENSVLDLWSLYDFLLPGYLGTAADFKERYETPLTSGPEPRTMERLRHRVRPFFLRRTKEEVLTELPPKLEFPTLCELTDEQREVYRAVLTQGRREVFEHSGKAGKGRDRIAVLTTLLRLRQVCCHLGLLPHGDEKHAWKEPSAKMDRAFELIDEARDGGHRVLLFSQFVRVLHLLRDEAQRREMRFCYLDGRTVERQAEVDRFQQNDNIPLFFISLKAGGTGLNLTGADAVIHFDPWWNPAVEEQATSRAHRMGQARSVQAYKLIAAGTVEEKIQALQARKRELFQASLGSDEAFVEKLTGDDLEELLAE